VSANNVTVGIRLTVDGRDVQGALNLTAQQLAELTNRINGSNAGTRDLNRTTEESVSVFQKYKAEILALAKAYGAYKVYDYIKDATLLAARYETLGIVMNITGNNAGYSATKMAEYQQGLEKSGISMLKSREALTDMAAAQLDLNRATELGRVAQDLAVVAGKNSSETLKQLVTNIQQADTQGLKYMGITLDQTAALNKYAVAHHTSVQALTARQKAEATLNEVVLQGAKYAGTYEQAMTTAGKALNSLDRYFENIKVKLGTPFLDGFAKGVFGVTDGVKKLNEWLDSLEKNGAMEAFSKKFGQGVGEVVSRIWSIISVVSEIAGVLAEVVTGLKDFLKEHENVFTAVKVAAGIYAAYMIGPFLVSTGAAFIAMTIQAWGMVTGIGTAFTAALAAARGFAAAFLLAGSIGGWGMVLVRGVVAAATMLGGALISLPVLVGAAVIAAGAGIGYLLWQAFGDAITERFPKTVQFIKDSFNSLKGLFSDEKAPTQTAAQKSAAIAKELETEELRQINEQTKLDQAKANLKKEADGQALLQASLAAKIAVAQVEATNTIMKAMNSSATAELQRQYDQRNIDQETFLGKKQIMDIAEINGTMAKIAADKAQLAAEIAAANSGTGGAARDTAADAAKMITLTAQMTAEQSKLNATKQDYAYRIGQAMIEAYTKEFGSVSALDDAKKALIISSRNEVQEAGKTASQVEALNASRLDASAQQLSDLVVRQIAEGKASKAFVDGANDQINAMKAMAQVRRESAISKTLAEMTSANQDLAKDTIDINNRIKNSFIGTEEEKLRIAQQGSIARMQLAVDEALALNRAGNGTDQQKMAKAREIEEGFAAYRIQLQTNTNAKILESSEGYKTLGEAMAAAFDPTKATAFGDAMTSSLGNAGSAVGNLAATYAKFQSDTAKNEQALAAARKAYAEDPVKMRQAETALAAKSFKDQIGFYSDMAAGAKGFFKENTTGYKLIEGAEKAFRLLQLANQMESLYTHLFVTTAKGAATVTGQAVETSAVVAGEAARNTAKVPGVYMAFMSALGPWGAAAAAVAIAAVMGGAFSGGGPSVDIAAERQKSQGTGTIMGDSSAKSDSVNRSVELTAANSSIALNYTFGMLNALRAIQSSLGNLGSILVRSGAVTGDVAPDKMGAVTGVLSKIPVIGGILGKISNSIFGGNTTTLDTGISASSAGLGSLLNGGKISASQYSDTKTDGGWFSSDKYRTNTTGLGAEANDQFTKIILSMRTSVLEAGKLLGIGGDGFAAKLNSFVVNIGKISTKGMSSDDIQKQLDAVFSKVGDEMAQFAVGGLQAFQKVGEGALETLTRVATNYANIDSILMGIGKTFGSVGMSSIPARENLVDLAGGIDKLSSMTNSYADNFLTAADKLAPVQKYVTEQMSALGYATVDTREEFKALVQSLDLSSPASQQLYVSLMQLQDSFAQVYAASEDLSMTEKDIASQRKDLQKQLDEMTMNSAQLRAKERATIADSNKALYDQVTSRKDLNDAYKTQTNAMDTMIKGLKSSQEAFVKFKDSLGLGNLSTLNPIQKAVEAQRQYMDMLAKAKSGDVAAQGGLSAAATAYLTANRAVNASSSAYTQAYNQVSQDMDDLIGITGEQIDSASMQLEALNKQVDGLVNLNETAKNIEELLANVRAADLAATKPSATLPVVLGQAIVNAPNQAMVAAIEKVADKVEDLKVANEQQTAASIEAAQAISDNEIDIANGKYGQYVNAQWYNFMMTQDVGSLV
jgi:hypothetical protein